MLLPDDQIKVLLLKSGGITEQAMQDLVTFAANARIPLQEAVIEKDAVTDEALGKLIADSLRVPFINLKTLTVSEEVLRIVPERVARKFKVVSFEKGADGVKLAMSDTNNKLLLEMIAKKTGLKIYSYLATERDIDNKMQLYRKDLQQTFDELLEEEISSTTNLADEAPIAKIVDLLITYAYRDKASDIHIEPEEKDSLVRFRIDGILHDVLFLDKKLHDRVLTRIKVLSRLRTDEHLSAQDGKMRMLVDDDNLDLRVSILPVTEGEKVVLRLLSSHFRQFSLLDLGMNETDLKKVNAAMNKSYGMILSTGPTGSGKTTSIYAILKILNTREKNITTIEDPVEYRMQGVNQIQVNTKTGLTFAAGLRSILRQDPNIIFVGEIRDSETAGIAVNAALTGHLVVSTLHTNDAATALPRLVDMKVEPFLVASTVNVIVAQRLVRKICESCKAQLSVKRVDIVKNLPEDAITKRFGKKPDIVVYQGKGCKVCHFTGYAGRIGIFEVLEMTENIRKLIAEKNDSDVIVKKAVEEGMTTMLDDGLNKVQEGQTTIEEVLRVTKVESM
ncbi:MAG: type II/IV secretion system protein [Patescibacteria group bacterium]|nr:type II/IV secretion system protein [Patescibacteria group bacterium]MDE2588812.1 type II/IV secretion system protein [Patescibacteria group bacterium]